MAARRRPPARLRRACDGAAMNRGVTWSPISVRGCRTPRSPVGVSPSATPSNSIRRCARSRPARRRWKSQPGCRPGARTRRQRGRYPVRRGGEVRFDTEWSGCAVPTISTKNAATQRKSVLVGYGADDTMDVSRRTSASEGARARASRRCANRAVPTCTSTYRVLYRGPDQRTSSP